MKINQILLGFIATISCINSMEKTWIYYRKEPELLPKERAQKIMRGEELDKQLINELAQLEGQGNNIPEKAIKKIKDLIAQGADVNFRYQVSDLPCPIKILNPLKMAIFTENTEIVKIVLDNGANPNRIGSLLHATLNEYILNSKKPNTAIIKLLIERGADINSQDYRKRTPLINAAIAGNLEIVQVLLQGSSQASFAQLQQLRLSEGSQSYLGLLPVDLMRLTAQYTTGANPNITDDEGQTALDYATNKLQYLFGWTSEAENYKKIIKLLKPITKKERSNKESSP